MGNSKIGSLRVLLSAGVAYAGLMAASAAHAQTDGTSGAEAETAGVENQTGLGTIVVTAQRRSQDLNDVGLSVITATGDELRDLGVTDLADLTAIVPGLTYTETPYGTGVLTLRGIGFYESSLAASSPTAVYVDEVPLPYPRLATAASLDVERVEVLKGPQGTLFGQNTTGGLVNYIAARPTDTPEFGMNLSIGRFLETTAEAFASGPLGDNIAARFSIRSQQGDDWQQSVTRDDDLGETHITMARLLVDWEPAPGFELQFNVNGFLDNSDTQAGQAYAFFATVPGAEQPQELTATLIPTGDPRAADWSPGKDFSRDNDFFQLAMRGSLDLSDSAELISITSYVEYNQFQFVDADGTNLETADVTQDGSISSFSQELRLQGELGRFRYVLGGNYSYDDIYDNTDFFVGDSSQAVAFPPFVLRTSRTYSNQTAETWAFFANGEFSLSDSLSVQGGIRYTDQSRDFSGCFSDSGDGTTSTLFGFAYGTTILPGNCVTFNPFTGVVGLVSDTLNEDNLSWRVNVNFEPTPDVLLYATVGRGYKAGSFPTVGGVLSVQYAPATQESVLSYEAGAKLTLANGNVQLNGAVYHYDYTDKQFRGKIIDSFFGPIERLYNVPSSSVTGFEVELQAMPVDGLVFGANLAYANTEVGSSFAGLSPIGTPINLQNETFEFTPRWAMSASVDYETSLNGRIDGFIGANARHQSGTHAGYGGLSIFEIPSYTIVDARVGIRAADDSWTAQLWTRNLFNEYYLTNANYLGEFAYRLTGRPVSYGVAIGTRF